MPHVRYSNDRIGIRGRAHVARPAVVHFKRGFGFGVLTVALHFPKKLWQCCLIQNLVIWRRNNEIVGGIGVCMHRNFHANRRNSRLTKLYTGGYKYDRLFTEDCPLLLFAMRAKYRRQC